jgi:hypothetical protein
MIHSLYKGYKTMNTIEGINTYLNELKLHDWHYKYSDDHSVYMSGSKHRKELHALADIYDHNYQIWDSIAPDQYKQGAY